MIGVTDDGPGWRFVSCGYLLGSDRILPGPVRPYQDRAGDRLAAAAPDGLAGNDDGGTLSAWLLFAQAGLYPVQGTDDYLLVHPRQERLEILLQQDFSRCNGRLHGYDA